MKIIQIMRSAFFNRSKKTAAAAQIGLFMEGNGVEAKARREVVVQLERRRARKRMLDGRMKAMDIKDLNGGPPVPDGLLPASGDGHEREEPTTERAHAQVRAKVQAQKHRPSESVLAPVTILDDAVPARGIRPPIPAAFIHEQLQPDAGAGPAKKRQASLGQPKQAVDAGLAKRMSEPRQRKRASYSQQPQREPAILRDQ